MDVSKPGKTPADATTRPIITGHAIMKDPMMNDESDKESVISGVTQDVPREDTPAPTPSISHKVIKPLDAQEPKPDADVPKQQPTDTEESTPDVVVDAVIDQISDKRKDEKLNAEDKKRQELVDSLVANKKYFVPIGQSHAKRNSKFLLIFLAAALPLLVGLVLAVDAGIIKTNIKLPFDFIKDKTAQPVPAASTTIPIAKPKFAATTTVFKNDQTGVTFTYPKDWGTVETVQKPRNSVPTGTADYEPVKTYFYQFSTVKSPVIEVSPTTWQYTGKATTYAKPLNDTTWASIWDVTNTASLKLLDEPNQKTAVFFDPAEQTTIETPGTVILKGAKKLANPKTNSNYVEFFYSPVSTDCVVTKTVAGKKVQSPSATCYDQTVTDQFAALVKSFQLIR